MTWDSVRKHRDGFVYFVQAENTLIKIGIASDPLKRILGLAGQNSSRIALLGLIECDEMGEYERAIHGLFESSRRHCEWFVPSNELLDFISNKANHPAIENINYRLQDVYKQ